MELGLGLELTGRLVLAAVLGFIIGIERRRTGHPAGDRTFALTALGAALFAEVSLFAFPGGDSRIAAGVVTGLGFLGAGMILKSEDMEIKGLTTAAGIWSVGAVGLAAGMGAYFLAIAGALLVLFLLAMESVFHIDLHIKPRN